MVAGCLGRLVRTGWYHQSRDGWSGVSFGLVCLSKEEAPAG